VDKLVNPHDRFFKQVLSRQEAASDFLRHYLPAEVAELLDFSSLELSKDSFVDQELQAHFSDLLYQVDLRSSPEGDVPGGKAYVYVLFEHKSYPEPLIALQLLRYMVRIWEQSLKQGMRLAPIVPVVVYHGRAKWKADLAFGSLFETPEAMMPFLPNYRYWLCDLSHYSHEEIKGGVILRVALLALKDILRDNFDQRLVETLALLSDLLLDLSTRQTGLEFLETLLRYLSQATDQITEEQLKEAVETVFPAGGVLMTTIAERWMEQGKQQGLQQGMQQGLQQGMRQGLQQGVQQGIREGLLAGITLVLELRFSSEGLRLLPEIYKIEDVDVLRAVHEGLKTAGTLEELRRIYR